MPGSVSLSDHRLNCHFFPDRCQCIRNNDRITVGWGVDKLASGPESLGAVLSPVSRTICEVIK